MWYPYWNRNKDLDTQKTLRSTRVGFVTFRASLHDHRNWLQTLRLNSHEYTERQQRTIIVSASTRSAGGTSPPNNRSIESQLLSDLFSHYDPEARPVLNPASAVNVSIDLVLNIIIELVRSPWIRCTAHARTH